MQYKITIKRNGRLYITPTPQNIVSVTLDKTLYYEKQDKHYMTNPRYGEIHLYSKKTGSTSIGFLYKVIKILRQHADKITVTDERIIKCHIGLENQTLSYNLYPFQQEAVSKYVNNPLKMGVLSIPTRGGKTYITMDIITKINLRTLILVTNVGLAEQWVNTLSKEFSSDEIGHIFKGKKKLRNITVAVDKSAWKYRDFLGNFNFIIVDECHHLSGSILRKVVNRCNNGIYKLGLSATPETQKDDQIRIESMVGNIIYKVERKELIKDEFIVNATVYYVKMLPRPDLMFSQYNDVYEEYIVNNHERNTKVINIANKSKGLVIVLINRIEHGELLYNMFIKNIDKHNNSKKLDKDRVMFVHGKTPDRFEIFQNAIDGKYDILISTKILNEGITLPNAITVILAGAGKSFIETTQKVGRILGTYKGKKMSYIYDFGDKCKYFDEQSDERRHILTQDFESIDIDVDLTSSQP